MNTGKTGIGTVYRVEELLRAVGSAKDGMGVLQLAQSVGIDVGLAHRYAKSLLSTGFLLKDERRRYFLGPLFEELAESSGHFQNQHLSPFVQSIINLQLEMNQTVSLSRWTREGPQVVLVLDGKSNLPITLRLGAVLPILSTAGGLVGLGFANRLETEPLVQRELRFHKESGLRTQLTSFDLDDMRADIVKRQAARSREYLQGLSAMSSPVFNESGIFWGAVSVVGPSSTFDWGWRGRTANALRAFCKRVKVPLECATSLRNYSSPNVELLAPPARNASV
ncbi:IclR family transcriptional regulator [Pseudoduganella sp. RAF53_2]|uniref:IclR family transcriptional regulator n=1 Tax=unclassified Pseudoduganella TaxID=2637179 RepID=UPI003F982ABF